MSTVTTLGIVSSIPGNVVFTPNTTSVKYPSYYLHPNLLVTITNSANNQTISFRSQVLGTNIDYGFDVGVSTASIDFTSIPAGFGQDANGNELGPSNYSTVSIFCGCDPQSPNYEALRFTGLFLRAEVTMWPHVYTMFCRGFLYLAMQYRQAFLVGLPTSLIPGSLPVGQPLINALDSQTGAVVIPGYFTGTLGVNSTDQNIVYDILAQVQNSAPVSGMSLLASNIGGTGKMIIAAVADCTWPPYRSAWDQIQLFDQTFLGFRTYEDVGGVIRRWQIFGYPYGPADTSFTEGIDIWDAHGSRTVEPLINGVYVEGSVGAAVGMQGGLAFAYVQQANPFQPASRPVIEQFRSPLIETADADTGGPGLGVGLNADRVAEWRLAEGNRQLVNVQLTTFRDDVLHSGHTVAVNTPHAAVTEPVWIQHVNIRVGNQPSLFQQTITGLGGGLPSYGTVITGTVTKSLGGTTVLGTGTSFTTELAVGDGIEIPSDDGNPVEDRTVTFISSDTSLGINAPWQYTGINQQLTITLSYTPPP